MKIINKYTNIALLALTAVGSIGLASCADEPDKFESTGGKPTIKYIRNLSSEVVKNTDTEETVYTNGQLVTSANPGSTLCVVGDNMRSIHDVYFNNIRAAVNSSTLTDNILIVTVPAAVPTDVSNKIYFVSTSNDTVKYDFKVTIAAPVVSSMVNEYAEANEVQTIKGNYFIDDPNVPLTVEFTGADGALIPAEILKETIAEDFTSMDIIIPEGAEPGPIYFTSVYGTSKAPFEYKDQRGMLFTFDDKLGVKDESGNQHGWKMPGSGGIKSDETSLCGNFLQFGGNTPDPVELTCGWVDGEWEYDYWPGSWGDPETFSDPYGYRLYDVVDFNDWANMTLKFEICIPEDRPWSGSATDPMAGTPMEIIFAPTSKVHNGAAGATDMAGNVLGGQNNSYFHDDKSFPRAFYRPWSSAENGVFHTGGKWITVSLPIAANWIYNYEGEIVNATLSKDFFAGFQILFWYGKSDDVEVKPCTPIIKLDNFRVVPMK